MRSLLFVVIAILLAATVAFGSPVLAFVFMGAKLTSAMQYGGLIAGAFITIITAAALLIRLLRP